MSASAFVLACFNSSVKDRASVSFNTPIPRSNSNADHSSWNGFFRPTFHLLGKSVELS